MPVLSVKHGQESLALIRARLLQLNKKVAVLSKHKLIGMAFLAKVGKSFVGFSLILLDYNVQCLFRLRG
jgi:hypothetical protein